MTVGIIKAVLFYQMIFGTKIQQTTADFNPKRKAVKKDVQKRKIRVTAKFASHWRLR